MFLSFCNSHTIMFFGCFVFWQFAIRRMSRFGQITSAGEVASLPRNQIWRCSRTIKRLIHSNKTTTSTYALIRGQLYIDSPSCISFTCDRLFEPIKLSCGRTCWQPRKLFRKLLEGVAITPTSFACTNALVRTYLVSVSLRSTSHVCRQIRDSGCLRKYHGDC